MNSFYIITNQEKDLGFAVTEQIREYLTSRGKTCTVQGETPADDAPHGYRYTDAGRLPGDVDCVLVLGGDGTLLQASRDLVSTGLPLLGINLGTLGYLAEIDRGSLTGALDRLVSGQFDIEERMMLRGVASDAGARTMNDVALNDIVIARSGALGVIDLKLYVDGSFLCAYRADGIIVSTPTGSTGYSLSAGGPVVSPSASLILLTPLAPHTLNSRPLILPDDVEVTVEIAGGEAAVTFDGDTGMPVGPGSRIRIRRSAQRTRLIKVNNTSFVELLRSKMN